MTVVARPDTAVDIRARLAALHGRHLKFAVVDYAGDEHRFFHDSDSRVLSCSCGWNGPGTIPAYLRHLLDVGSAVLEQLGALPPHSTRTVATLLDGHHRYSGADVLVVAEAVCR